MADATAELLIERALDAAAAPWRLRLEGEKLVPPPAMAGQGRIEIEPVLEAYRHLPMNLELLLGLDEAGKALMEREQHLRALAARPEATEAEALLILQREYPDPHADRTSLREVTRLAPFGWTPTAGCAPHNAQDWCAGLPYFAAPCAWLRYRLRRALAAGEPLPSPAQLPLEALRHEADLLERLGLARCGEGALEEGLGLLQQVPVIISGGWLLYIMVDACIRARDLRFGLPLAEFGVSFFDRWEELFKSLQFNQKAALLAADQFPDRPELGGAPIAVAHHARAIALGEPPMILDSLRLSLIRIPETAAENGPLMAPLVAALTSRPAELLAQAAALQLNLPGGGDGPHNRRVIALLTAAMARRDTPMVSVPAIAATEPALFGILLRQRLEHLPGLAADAVRLAAYSSGFTDMGATSAHLSHLLAFGDRDGVAAIAAFLTRRFGMRWQTDDEVTAIVSTLNVGDTLLHLVGLVAFAQLANRPVRVLYRRSRRNLVDMLPDAPLLRFEPIDDTEQIPQQLALNRLAPGSVSVFYNAAWFWAQERQRIPDIDRYGGFLWNKILSVMLSGGDCLPAQVVPSPRMLRIPDIHTDAARARFAQLPLKRGRTVFLSPLANTLFVLTDSRFNGFREFWQAAIRVFRQHGFTVAINVLNNHNAEAGLGGEDAVQVALDLREAPGFVAECGYFAGVRSGLCDLIALCDMGTLLSKTVYEKGAEHCIGLAQFGMPEVVADFRSAPPEEVARGLFQDWLN
jgi:hypothetical protein